MADERFLVVRLGSLGDIVHTFPAVAGLRESFPNSTIVWLTHPRWTELVASSGEERQLCRGDMMLLQDVAGQGHMTRFLGLEACTYLTIAMPGGFK